MPRIIIVPPPMIIDLDDLKYCDGCLMSEYKTHLMILYCPVLNRRLRVDEDGRHPRPELCTRAYLRDAREDETDRDAEEIRLEIKEITP